MLPRGYPMKVVVTDYTFPNLDVESAALAPLGCELVVVQCKTAAEAAAVVRDADCVITQFAQSMARSSPP